MRVLIPGVTGQLGRIVAQKLDEAGHEVIGIDRRPWYGAPKRVQIYQVDIRKRGAEDVFRKHRPEAVVHMATVTHVFNKSDDRYRINLGGTRAVFDHSVAYGVKQVLFVGRHTFYGAGADSPLYHTEDEPPIASSPFPELADLVAADLYAGSALWRFPALSTAVLRIVYTLGPSKHGTLAQFLDPARVPCVMGFDPLFHFMHENDVAGAIQLALEKNIRGVFNVAGPAPLPLSLIIRKAQRMPLPLPEFVFSSALGRFGLPRLTAGAIAHIKYPVVVDSKRFHEATGFVPKRTAEETIEEFRLSRVVTSSAG
jgi:UDP-glucose 4-epimerase